MWSSIKEIVGKLFGSRKVMMSVGGVVVSLAAKVGLDLPNEIVMSILGLVGVYVFGQSLVDKNEKPNQLGIEFQRERAERANEKMAEAMRQNLVTPQDDQEG